MNTNRLFPQPEKPAPTLPEVGFVRLPQVLAFTGLSKSTWYDGIKEGIYPQQVKIGKRAVGWEVNQLRNWFNKPAS